MFFVEISLKFFVSFAEIFFVLFVKIFLKFFVGFIEIFFESFVTFEIFRGDLLRVSLGLPARP